MQTDNNTSGAGDESTTGTTANAANTDSTTATDAGKGEGQGGADNGGKADDTTGTTNDDGKTGDEDGDGKDDDQPQGAPEKYEGFTLPEGYGLEGDRLDMAHEFARANNWTQEQAQQGVDTYLRFRAAEMEHERGMWGAQSEEEFGKDFAGISDGAQRALVEAEKLRPGITDRLDATNLGNHPDILWAFNQLGVLAKAQPSRGLENETASTVQGQSPGERMYQYADKPVPGSKPK